MCVVQKHLSFTSATAEGSTRTVSSTKGPTERGDSRLKTQDSRLKEREEHRSNLKFCRFFAIFFTKISGFSRIFAKFC